jgi:hypothetical protein
MSQTGLESFGAYPKARQLFGLVVTDMDALKTNPLCYRLVFSANRQRRFDLRKHRRAKAQLH